METRLNQLRALTGTDQVQRDAAIEVICNRDGGESPGFRNACALARFRTDQDSRKFVLALDTSRRAQHEMSAMSTELSQECKAPTGCSMPFGFAGIGEAISGTLFDLANGGEAAALSALLRLKVESDGGLAESIANDLGKLFASRPGVVVDSWQEVKKFNGRISLTHADPVMIKRDEILRIYREEFERHGMSPDLATDLVSGFYFD